MVYADSCRMFAGKGYPSKAQRYSIFPPRNRMYSPLDQLYAVATLCTFGPVILFTLWWAAIAGGATVQGFIAAAVFGVPPYNFGPSGIGLTNLAPVFGMLLGLNLAGIVCDWDLAYQTKRNGGIREPEMRLRPAVIGGIFASLGNIIFSLGVEHKWHWALVLIPGQGLVSPSPQCASTVSWRSSAPFRPRQNAFATAFAVVSATNYATDTYKAFGIEIAGITSVAQNCWAMVVSTIINDLYVNQGALKSLNLIAIPLYAMIPITVLMVSVTQTWMSYRLSGRLSLMTVAGYAFRCTLANRSGAFQGRAGLCRKNDLRIWSCVRGGLLGY